MFIVLEGIDGAGTTTQVDRLAANLRANGRSCHTTCEPSGRPIGKLIRQALQRDIVLPDGQTLDPVSLALLFAADRMDHVRAEVEPALDRGDVVISDRYVHSSLAYQGTTLDMRWIDAINAQARTADLVIWLDVPVEICMSRMAQRDQVREIYETADVLRRVQQAYERAMRIRPERVRRIDGTGSQEDVAHRIWHVVTSQWDVASASVSR